jgi:RHS repeat-associated protein
MSRTGNSESLFLFSGLFGVLTDPNRLAYMRYRWYSPEIHRFINQDAHFGSITDAGSLNRYSYAGSNPVTRGDPKGEF